MNLRNLALMLVLLILTACGSMTRWYTSYGIPSKQAVTDVQYVPSLIQALHDENRRTVISAAKALATIGPAAENSLSALAEVAKGDQHLKARTHAIRAMVVIGKEHPVTVDTLSELMLSGKPGKIRVAAARALTLLGPSAAPAIPALTEALNSRYAKVRNYAAKALAYIGPPARDALTALEKLSVGDERSAVQSSAKEAIRRITYETRTD